MRRFLASAVLLCAVASVATAASIFADVTGKWNLTVSTPDGSQPAVMNVTQKNDSLSGSVETQLGTAPMTGTVSGDSVFFNFSLDMGGQALVIRGSAAVKEGDKIDGVLDVAGMGAIPFSGAREK